MLSFLFWNLNGNGPTDRSDAMRTRVTRLAKHYDIDVFIFVESRFEPADLAGLISGVGAGTYWHSASVCTRIQLFTRLPTNDVIPQFDAVDDKLTMRRLTVDSREILVAAVHLRSQLHQQEKAGGFQAITVRNEFEKEEESLNNYKTILVGDLNMNPFSDGMVAAHAFHGVMTRNLANAKERFVEGRSHRFFYNPMWGFLGDRSPGPAGTYFYRGSSSIEYFWHVFDQVLLRPELMNALDDVAILEDDGEMPLLTQSGRPDRATASDHLPLLFRLDLSRLEGLK